MNTPDPILIRRWIAALRSGRYTQTTCYLRVRNSYCCLGVLCDITEDRWQPPVDGDTIVPYAGFFDVPPQNICDLAGLGPNHPAANGGYVPELTSMNDRGTPFTEIADYIEQHILPQASPTSLQSSEL